MDTKVSEEPSASNDQSYRASHSLNPTSIYLGVFVFAAGPRAVHSGGLQGPQVVSFSTRPTCQPACSLARVWFLSYEIEAV
jgi:hypothetical protein